MSHFYKGVVFRKFYGVLFLRQQKTWRFLRSAWFFC